MYNKVEFYQESGQINVSRTLISYLLLILVTWLLGYCYTMLIVFIPIIYFNFFITIGYGFALSYLVRILVRISHNRNKTSRVVLAVVAGLLANYFQWIAYVLYAYLGEIPSLQQYISNLTFLVNPQNFFPVIAEINRVGLWKIGQIPFNGVFLTLVWLVEFLIIMAIPVATAIILKVFPYSDTFGKWYDKFTLSHDFESISSANSITEKITENPLKAIEELKFGDGWRHAKIHIFYIKEEVKQYLSVERIFVSGRGKGEMDSTIVVDKLKIDTSAAKAILEKYRNSKEKLEII